MDIKICGATSLDEISILEQEGATYVGVWTGIAGDRRSVPDSLFLKLVEGCKTIRPVAVCVSRPVDELLALLREAGVSHVQMHGFNTPRDIARLSEQGLTIIKTLHIADDGTSPEAGLIGKYADSGCDVFLIDRYAGPHLIGSGGRPLKESVVRQWIGKLAAHRVWLAGGLTPGRIAELTEEGLVDVADVDSAARQAGLISRTATRLLVSAARSSQNADAPSRSAKSSTLV